MKIDWKPSEKTRNQARKIRVLREQGVTYPQIGKIFPYHRTYLVALWHLGKELHEKEQKEE